VNLISVVLMPYFSWLVRNDASVLISVHKVHVMSGNVYSVLITFWRWRMLLAVSRTSLKPKHSICLLADMVNYTGR